MLCRKHLLGEHRELHALFTIVKEGKKGYANHPETKRWYGKLAALAKRHEALVLEMERRGYQHHSPLGDVPSDSAIQDVLLEPVDVQMQKLCEKPCECLLGV